MTTVSARCKKGRRGAVSEERRSNHQIPSTMPKPTAFCCDPRPFDGLRAATTDSTALYSGPALVRFHGGGRRIVKRLFVLRSFLRRLWCVCPGLLGVLVRFSRTCDTVPIEHRRGFCKERIHLICGNLATFQVITLVNFRFPRSAGSLPQSSEGRED